MPIKACLADVYCTIPNVGTKELQDAMLMIVPRPRSRIPVRPRQLRGSCFFMTLLTALTKRRDPLTLTLKKASNSEMSVSATSAGCCTPICRRTPVRVLGFADELTSYESYPCAGHCIVDPTEYLNGLLDHRIHALLRGDIHGQRNCAVELIGCKGLALFGCQLSVD